MERKEDITGEEFLEMAMRAGMSLVQCPIPSLVPVPDGSVFR